MLLRRVVIPSLGAIWVRPLEYGDAIWFYENRRETSERLADMFNQCFPHFTNGQITAEDVEGMKAMYPPLLEYVVLLASDMAGNSDSDESDSDTEDDQEFSDSIFAAHNQEPDMELDEYTEADLIYQLHQINCTYDDIYGMLMGEIELLMEGGERYNKRQEQEMEDADSTNDSPKDPAKHGNSSDHAKRLGFRK